MKQQLQTFWIRLTADPRRFGMLCACCGIGLLLWARLILVSDLPRMAIADPSEAAESPSDETDRAGDALRTTQSVTLDERPLRDPFAVSDDVFPRPRNPEVLPTNTGKSRPLKAEEVSTALLRDFVVDSDDPKRWTVSVIVVPGLAIVGAKSVRIGERIAAGPGGHPVVLAEVRQRSIVVRCGDAELVLQMSGPTMGGE